MKTLNTKMTRKLGACLLASLLAGAFVTGGSLTAQAEELTSESASEELTLVTQDADGNWQPVDPIASTAERNPDFDLPPSAPGEVSPYLVSPLDHNKCMILNQSNLVFAKYTWVDNGVGIPIELKCGNSGYGYKHMVEGGKDTNWTTILNNAKAAGWDAQNYRVYKWDDLMHIVAANQLGSPGGYYQVNYNTNKGCINSLYGLWSTQTHTLVYSFRAEVVWSVNNKRIITSFPSSRQVCNT